jgi:hypothetical protein
VLFGILLERHELRLGDVDGIDPPAGSEVDLVPTVVDAGFGPARTADRFRLGLVLASSR